MAQSRSTQKYKRKNTLLLHTLLNPKRREHELPQEFLTGGVWSAALGLEQVDVPIDVLGVLVFLNIITSGSNGVLLEVKAHMYANAIAENNKNFGGTEKLEKIVGKKQFGVKVKSGKTISLGTVTYKIASEELGGDSITSLSGRHERWQFPGLRQRCYFLQIITSRSRFLKKKITGSENIFVESFQALRCKPVTHH